MRSRHQSSGKRSYCADFLRNDRIVDISNCLSQRHRGSDRDLDIFASFLDERYDADDLIFYGFTKSVLLGEETRAKEVSARQCFAAAEVMVKKMPHLQEEAFLEFIDSSLETLGKRPGRATVNTKAISVTDFLLFALAQFRLARGIVENTEQPSEATMTSSRANQSVRNTAEEVFDALDANGDGKPADF